MSEIEHPEPWDVISTLIAENDPEKLGEYIDELSGADKSLAISRLDDGVRASLLDQLTTEDAADLMKDIFDDQAADLIEDLPTEKAAAIIDEMASDEQADILGHLEVDRAEEILQEMDPEEAEDARLLLQSPVNSAGGMMITEFLVYRESMLVTDVIRDLRKNRKEYSDYEVQYTYITSEQDELVGVLPLRQLLLSGKNVPLSELAIPDPVHVSASASLTELKSIFDHSGFIGIPVSDSNAKILGVVLRKAVLEAVDEADNRAFLNFSGIVGGEELRSMPLLSRSFRRLSWLSVNIVLNMIAASVIAFYQDTLESAIVLAVFLPIISDMSGCSGNQAVAVSIRELTLGQVKSHELFRVLSKEAGVGLINGIVLGALIGGAALAWKGNIYLGMVVGGALALNSLFAVCLGGMIPLMLSHRKMDPALASSPILTTITDMCGFFFVLSFATALLPKLGV